MKNENYGYGMSQPTTPEFFECVKCHRKQGCAKQGVQGGIDFNEAAAIGWKFYVEYGTHCPFCDLSRKIKIRNWFRGLKYFRSRWKERWYYIRKGQFVLFKYDGEDKMYLCRDSEKLFFHSKFGNHQMLVFGYFGVISVKIFMKKFFKSNKLQVTEYSDVAFMNAVMEKGDENES